MKTYDSKKWIDIFFDKARQESLSSKDKTKIGCVIIGKYGQTLSAGFNGFPRGFNDDNVLADNRQWKLERVVHAEQNGIYNACLNGVSLNDASLFLYGLPVCNECAKGIIQTGIKKVYMKFKYTDNRWLESFNITKEMFEECNVEYYVYNLEEKE